MFFCQSLRFTALSQPPCEAVSWNANRFKWYLCLSGVSLLVRLWVEIPTMLWKPETILVSLLVRLWVEMIQNVQSCSETVVSLLVRLWVEILLLVLFHFHMLRQPPCEAVSWNIHFSESLCYLICQPPCEAVSWNKLLEKYSEGLICVSLLVRLWVEITYKILQLFDCQSASLWGCELKSFKWKVTEVTY